MTRELTEADIGKTFKTVNGSSATILCRLDGPDGLCVWAARLSSDGDWDELAVYACIGECLDDPSESGYDIVFPPEMVLFRRGFISGGLRREWREHNRSLPFPCLPKDVSGTEEFAWFERVTE